MLQKKIIYNFMEYKLFLHILIKLFVKLNIKHRFMHKKDKNHEVINV